MALRSLKFLAPLAILTILVTGCGSEESAGGGGGEPVTVTAENIAFHPTSLNLDAGTEVEITLENKDDTEHSFTIEDPSFEIEAEGGDSASGSFTVPDSDVEWFCKYHPDQMRGTISVGGAAGGGTMDDDDDMKEDDDNKKDSNDNNGGGYDY